jgi:hypothetical protein
MKICKLQIDVPVGGAAVTTSDRIYHGYIEKIVYDHIDACAETNIDFSTTGGAVAQGFLRCIEIGDTDCVIYPRLPPVDNTNTAISNEPARIRIDGKIVARTLASCGACTVILYVYIKEE